MPLRRLLPFLLLLWPIAEIATFIWVGGRIGILQTILLILAAGLIGTWMLRAEGLRLLASIQRDMARGELPADKILHGALLALAGLLLLLPGFLSDVPGFLLLLPPVRAGVIRLVRAKGVVVARTTRAYGSRVYTRDGVVDLDPTDYGPAGAPRSADPTDPVGDDTRYLGPR